MIYLRTFRIALALVMAVALTASQLWAAEIQIKQSTTVDSELILLSDIAEIRSVAPEARKKLSAIEIGPAPQKGTAQQFDYRMIRSRLLANGVNLADLKVTGHRAVAVSRPKDEPRKNPTLKQVVDRPITATTREREQANRLLEPVLLAYLEEHAPNLGKVSLNVGLPSEVARAFSKVLPRSIVVLGVSSLGNDRYRFRVSGTQFSRNPIEALLVVEVTSWPFVLAAKTSLPRGHVVTTADLDWVQQEDTSGAFTRVDQVIGREVVRTIRQDMPLGMKDLRNTPLVRRNDKVTVYVRTATFSVQKLFRAREDGALGDVIELVNDQGKIVTAKVTAYHEAEIDLDAPPVRSVGSQKLPLVNSGNRQALPRPQLSRIPERPFQPERETAPPQRENWDNHSASNFDKNQPISAASFRQTYANKKGVTWSNGAAKRNR